MCDSAAIHAQPIRVKLGHHLLGYPLMQPIPSTYLSLYLRPGSVALPVLLVLCLFLAPLVRVVFVVPVGFQQTRSTT